MTTNTPQTKNTAATANQNPAAPVLARPTAAVATPAPASTPAAIPAPKPAVTSIKPAATKPAPKAAPKAAAKPAPKAAAPKPKAKPAAKKKKPAAKTSAAKPAFKAAASKPSAKATASKPFVKTPAGAAFPPLFGSSLIGKAPALALPEEIKDAFTAALNESTRTLEKAAVEQTREFAKAQKQFFDFSSDTVAKAAKSVDQAAQSLNDSISASKQNVEAFIESGNLASSLSKSIGSKIAEIGNSMMSENINALQQFLTCRTASDLMNLQNDYIRSNVDSAFNGSLKIAELFAQYSAKIAEPINERIADATEKFAKKVRK